MQYFASIKVARLSSIGFQTGVFKVFCQIEINVFRMLLFDSYFSLIQVNFQENVWKVLKSLKGLERLKYSSGVLNSLTTTSDATFFAIIYAYFSCF